MTRPPPSRLVHAADRHLEVDSVVGWKEIRRPALSLLHWKRSVPKRLSGWVDRVVPTLLLDLSLRSPARSFPEEALRAALPPSGEGLELFIEDLALLWRRYRALMRPQTVHLKLATIAHQMCPKYHCDNVHLRLVCSYAGAGTLWLPERAVDRRGLHPEPLEGARPRQLQRFEVGLLKGVAWPGNAALGAVHRSPHAHGGPRLLLSLDTVGGHRHLPTSKLVSLEVHPKVVTVATP